MFNITLYLVYQCIVISEIQRYIRMISDIIMNKNNTSRVIRLKNTTIIMFIPHLTLSTTPSTPQRRDNCLGEADLVVQLRL